MGLRIDLAGNVDHVVISVLPRTYVNRIYTHCRGKNNTPYFANNCFKGVLYFDTELARKFAEQVGYDWKPWQEENRFFSSKRLCMETNLEVGVVVDGSKIMELPPSVLATNLNEHSPADYLANVGDEDVLVLMGAVDKGTASFLLDDFSGEFDPSRLELQLDCFDEFLFKDSIITSMTYDGQEMRLEKGKSRGKNMITPVLFSRAGEELDMNDFPD